MEVTKEYMLGQGRISTDLSFFKNNPNLHLGQHQGILSKKIVEEVHKIQDQYLKKEKLMQTTYRALCDIRPKDMVATLQRLSYHKIVEELEAKINFLLKEIGKLKGNLGWKTKKAQLSM